MLRAALTLLYLCLKIMFWALFILSFMLIYAYCLCPAGYETLYRIYIGRHIEDIWSSMEDGSFRGFLLSDMVSVRSSTLLSRLTVTARRACPPRVSESESEGDSEEDEIPFVSGETIPEQELEEIEAEEVFLSALSIGDRDDSVAQEVVSLEDLDQDSNSVLLQEEDELSL